MKGFALSILLLMLTVNTYAAYTVTEKNIEKTHVNLNSGYYFKTSGNMVDPDNCGSTDWYRLPNDTYTKDAFALILAAHMSNKKVNFYLQGCVGSYPKVIWVNTVN